MVSLETSFLTARLRASLNDHFREKCSHTSVYAALFPESDRSNLPRSQTVIVS